MHLEEIRGEIARLDAELAALEPDERKAWATYQEEQQRLSDAWRKLYQQQNAIVKRLEKLRIQEEAIAELTQLSVVKEVEAA